MIFYHPVPSQPPTFLSLYNTSSTSLRVTWLAIPVRYVHGVLLGYRVLYRSLNVTKEKYEFKEVEPASLEVVLTGLFKYMDYGIRVLGFTKVGLGTVSNEVIVKTDQDGRIMFHIITHTVESHFHIMIACAKATLFSKETLLFFGLMPHLTTLVQHN